MKIFVLTECITNNEKCRIDECEIFLDEQAAKDAITTGIKKSIGDCVEKYGINPNNIEPKNDQGATVVQMYDGTYTWKIKKFESELNPGDPVFILLHAHNRGYISYAESRIHSTLENALSSMKKSHENSLSMWRLMLGQGQFQSVVSEIADESAKIQLGGEIEAWRIEERKIPVPEVPQPTT